MLTFPVSASFAVAGHSEPMPDGAPLAPYTGGLGTTLGGPAAVDAPTGGSSLSCLSFKDLLITVRVLELSGGYVPDSFLDSLPGLVAFPSDHLFAVSSDSLADSVSSLCARAFNPVNPTPGCSKDGDNIIPFLCSLVGVSASPPPPRLVGPAVFAQLWVLGL